MKVIIKLVWTIRIKSRIIGKHDVPPLLTPEHVISFRFQSYSLFTL